ncbi:unnamed protein product [Rotaria sp. Silwood1]|nr:unnamed protein product [Rotaria sp. Silwood1]
MTNGQLPTDPYGIYLLLSSPDVKEGSGLSGFCGSYCGYHGAFSSNGVTYAYGFIGNPKNCMTSCSVFNRNISPNGDPGVDAMLSTMGHEMVEMKSDPMLNAWFDGNGAENADKW